MQKKTAAALLLTLTLVFGIFFAPETLAAVLTFETQYDYDAADPSWLTDLVIKENMDSAPGLGSDVVLKAEPDYPYTETADSFRADVERFCEIYTLDERTPRASYVFLFEFLNQNAGSVSAQVTDDVVRDYLENAGVEYPAAAGTDDLVFARALYTALVSGSAGGVLPTEADPAISLDKALVRYLTSLSGLSEGELKKWTPDGRVASVDEYVLAASRLLLWTNGYDVRPDTTEAEVYRLTGVMTLKTMGVSISADASFAELQSKYTAALLGRRYGVTVDPSRLSAAMKDGDAAFYMLQLIGKDAGLSIREDRYTYEEAFLAVASNSDAFSLEDGEFYADIYRYSASLKYKSAYLWVYPTAYATGLEDAVIVVSVNDTTVKNNYFNRVRLDPDAGTQTLKIMADVTVGGKRSLSVYYITVTEGTAEYVPPVLPIDVTAQTQDSGTLMSQILAKFGVSASILDTVDDVVYTMLPSAVRSVITFIAPTFSESLFAEVGDVQADEGDAQSAQPARTSYFTGLLDKIGSVIDVTISGIRGAEFGGKKPYNNVSYNYITVE